MSKRPSTRKAGGKTSAKSKPRVKKPAAAAPAEPIEFEPPKRRGPGRPTTYDPSFCDRVIELGEQGKSKAQIASALGCSRKSLYLWIKVHPEFAEAMDEAMFAAFAWWEDAGQQGLKMGSKFNASLYAYAMKNRFRDHYGDKVDIAHSGNVEAADPNERRLSNVDLARRVAFMLSEAVLQQRQQANA